MNKQVKYNCIIILLLISSIFLSGCKKTVQELPKMHYSYFGLLPGRYVIYDVVEISHDVDLLPQHDTIKYQLKTLIGNEIIDNQGRKVREFFRFKRKDNYEKWVIKDVWTSIIDNNKAELVEENQRVIKLVFAPTIDKKWNPNTYNTSDSVLFYYSNIHKKMKCNNIEFDSTLTVKKDDFFSLIDYKKTNEIYASDIGLISKTYKNLTISNFDTLNVKKGNEIHYKCIAFGFE